MADLAGLDRDRVALRPLRPAGTPAGLPAPWRSADKALALREATNWLRPVEFHDVERRESPSASWFVVPEAVQPPSTG